jgi:hypothetical protein
MGLSNTFDGMNWHITGLVKDYAGFGLYLASTSNVSMFGGMSFDISGTVTMVGTAAPPTLSANMSITDVAHAVDSLHTADGSMTCGTCAPTSSQYDGTCASPAKVIPITATSVTQTVHWAELHRREPQPDVDHRHRLGAALERSDVGAVHGRPRHRQHQVHRALTLAGVGGSKGASRFEPSPTAHGTL